jgi:SPX domain protein involved in polyphosphate accumulation
MSEKLTKTTIDNSSSSVSRTDKSAVALRKSPKKKPADKVLSCRYEIKYRISETVAGAIAAYITPYLHVDKYARTQPTGDYPISSLYYDSDCLRLCRDTMDKRKNRFKLRIRTYSDEPGVPCFFEVKRRINNVILKGRARVKKDDIPFILSGRIPENTYKEDVQVLRQFQLYKDLLNARPLMLVRYNRQAWEGDTATRVRVTFDRDLSYKAVTGPNVEVNGPYWHRVPLNFVILEIKFTQRFPIWLSHMVKCFNLKQSAFSKIVSTVKQSNALGATSPIKMMGQ